MNDWSIRGFEYPCDCRGRDYPSPVTGPEDQQLCIYICRYLLLIYQGISSTFNASAVREPVVPTLLTDRREVWASMSAHACHVPVPECENLSILEWVNRGNWGLQSKEHVLELLNENSGQDEFATDECRVMGIV